MSDSRDFLPLQHNIISLLYAIQGMAQSHFSQAREGHWGQTQDRLRHAEEILKKNQTQAEAALGIARRLGKLRRRETKSRKSPLRASLARTWQGTRRRLEKEFPLAGIEIIERIPEDFPPLSCDPEELQEIFYPLAKNALQAVKDKGAGKIILRAQVGFNVQEEPCAVIVLSDTGPGIPQEELPHLFHPFFTTKPEGNGLGLYVVRALVGKNQGRITVSSFEGCGTTFTLEFPLASETPLPLQKLSPF